MSEERKKILEMLSSGKISVEEAERLIAALSENNSADQSASNKSSKKIFGEVLILILNYMKLY